MNFLLEWSLTMTRRSSATYENQALISLRVTIELYDSGFILRQPFPDLITSQQLLTRFLRKMDGHCFKLYYLIFELISDSIHVFHISVISSKIEKKFIFRNTSERYRPLNAHLVIFVTIAETIPGLFVKP